MERLVDDYGKVYLFTDTEAERALKRSKNREKWLRYVKCADSNCGKEFQRLSRMVDKNGRSGGRVPSLRYLPLYCSAECRNRFNARKSMRKLRYKKREIWTE